MPDQPPPSESARYPLFPLHNAIRVALAVKDSGGANVDVPKASIASQLGGSATSGAFLQRLSSARSFGLIEGRGSYRLTPQAKRYFFPGSEEEKKKAMLTFITSPPVFHEVIKRFDGNVLPAPEMLANILHRELGVADSWKERIAGFFARAMMQAGVIDAQGYLRYRAAQHSMTSETPIKSTGIVVEPPPTSSNTQETGGFQSSPVTDSPPQNGGVNAWKYSYEGQTVRVETTGEISPQLWRKLNAYVQVLKPMEEDA